MPNPILMLKDKLRGRLQKDLAQEIGISAVYLGEILRRAKPPSKSVLDFLGLERCVIYRRKRDD